MDPFARLIDTCFAQLGVAAIYQPQAGAPRAVRVIARRPDTVVGFGETRLASPTAVFEVRVSEVAAPRPGDRLRVGDLTSRVQGEPVRHDPDRLVWTLEAVPA